VFLSEPGKTPYDLNFNILGFDCRVHPAFFVLPVLFGANIGGGDMNAGVGILVMALVFFVSILVHELGHTLAFRYYGIHSRVVLYWMGGLAIPDSGGWMRQSNAKSLKPEQQIVVSGAGPAAGLLLAALATLLMVGLGYRVSLPLDGPIPFPHFSKTEHSMLSNLPVLETMLLMFVVVNIFLNLLNLLPVFPLDGGQIARQIFVKVDPWGGVRNSVILSLVVAVFIALYAFKVDRFMGFFFGFMAWSNFQMLQNSGNNRRPW